MQGRYKFLIMKNIFLLSFLILSHWLGKAQVSYDTYFTKESLRLDFYFYGTSENTFVSLKGLKQEPFFGGSYTHLIHPNQGEYRIEVKDAKENKIIYSKGFNTLVEEWQSSEKDKNSVQIFEIPLQVPFPKVPIIVEISRRKYSDGLFKSLYSKEILPDDYHIIKESIPEYPVTTILHNGESNKKVDLVFLPEGYTQNDIPKFISDVKRMVDYLFTIPPYDKHKQDFNIYAIEAPSLEKGTDIDGERIYKNTLFDTHFYTFDIPYYLTCPSIFKVADVAGQLPYDQICILVNTDQYGGGGFYNFLNLVTADDRLSDKVFVHEFGHGFIGLADEYYYDTDMGNRYNLKLEPWEANITTLVDFQSKWKDMMDKRTPIPTPRTEKYKNKIGAFEGGGYLSKGIYSPMQDCRMKSNEPKGFCSICTRAIERVMRLYTE